jgi:outer membrane protein TolC
MSKIYKKIICITIVNLIMLASCPLVFTQTITLSEAIQTTFQNNLNIKIQKTRIEQKQGTVQQAAGEFDWIAFGSVSRQEKGLPVSKSAQQNQQDQQDQQNTLITQNETLLSTLAIPYTHTPLYNDPIITKTDETKNIYSLGVNKRLRNGINVNLSVFTLDYENNMETEQPETRSDVNFEIVIPLGRGLGKENSAAREMAAVSTLNATRLLSRHNISKQIYMTTVSFWNCLAATQRLFLLKDTEKRAIQIFDLIELLINAGELESALRHQAQAQLYEKKSAIQDAQLELLKTRVTLAVAMGYDTKNQPSSPLPRGKFPEINKDLAFDSARNDYYIEHALKNRDDFLAAKKSIETENILLTKANNDKKPKVDFLMRTGYAGLNENHGLERFSEALGRNTTGPNFYASISMELPLFNDAARGGIISQQSLLREARLNSDQLSNKISSEVLITVEKIKTISEQYQFAKQTEESYKAASKHEYFKVREGLSSLNELIDLEDKYTKARAIRIDSLRRYANALAELRFTSGTLLTKSGDAFSLKARRLMTLP